MDDQNDSLGSAQDEIDSCFASTFSSPPGKRVLGELLKLSKFYSISLSADLIELAREVGARNLVAHILRRVMAGSRIKGEPDPLENITNH